MKEETAMALSGIFGMIVIFPIFLGLVYIAPLGIQLLGWVLLVVIAFAFVIGLITLNYQIEAWRSRGSRDQIRKARSTARYPLLRNIFFLLSAIMIISTAFYGGFLLARTVFTVGMTLLLTAVIILWQFGSQMLKEM